MKQQRLDNIQLLRGIAATMVIVGHAFGQFQNHPIAGLAALHDPVGSAWAVGVDIFFVISGFIMFHLTHDHFGEAGYPLEFIKRRILRVAPTYWLFTAAMVLVSLLFPSGVNNGVGSLWHVVSSFLFIPSPRADGMLHPVYGLGWTLNYEFFFYFCFAIALLAPLRRGLTGLLLFFGCLVLAHDRLPSGPLYFWSDAIILEFLAGILVAAAFTRGVRINSKLLVVALLVAGAAALIEFAHFEEGMQRFVSAGLPAIVIVTALALAPPIKWWPVLILIGDASYSLYLAHPFALNVLTVVWKQFHMPLESHLYMTALVMGALGGGIAVYKLIELPLVRFVRSRFEPRRGILPA